MISPTSVMTAAMMPPTSIPYQRNSSAWFDGGIASALHSSWGRVHMREHGLDPSFRHAIPGSDFIGYAHHTAARDTGYSQCN